MVAMIKKLTAVKGKQLLGTSALLVACLTGCATAEAGLPGSTCAATPNPDGDGAIVAAKSGFDYIGVGTSDVNMRGSYSLVTQCVGGSTLNFAIELDGTNVANVGMKCDGKLQTTPVLTEVSGKHTLVLRPLANTPRDTVAVIRPTSC